MFDEDWPAACEAETIETGAPLDESGWSTAVPASETTSGGWGRRPEGDAPRSEASALGARRLSPARPQPPISCHPQRPTWNRAPQRPRRHPKPRSTNYRPRSTQTGPGRARTPTTSRTHRKKDRVRERPRRHPKPQSTVHARRSTVTRGGGMHCRSRLVFGYAFNAQEKPGLLAQWHHPDPLALALSPVGRGELEKRTAIFISLALAGRWCPKGG